MKRFVLLINGNLGLEVLRYIITQKETEITGIIINATNKRSSTYLGLVQGVLSEFNLTVPIITFENMANNHLEINELFYNSDYGISALFGHVLPQAILENIECEIINLHPSPLPIGRGANPIPWSIIGQHKQGITIHIIDSGLDTGEILSQKEFSTDIGMNSGEIYDLATNLLLKELENIFPSWINKSIEGTKQSNYSSPPHKSRELENMRVIKLDEVGTFGEFLRKLQALTFSDSRKPSFIDNSGRLWSINISVTLHGEED